MRRQRQREGERLEMHEGARRDRSGDGLRAIWLVAGVVGDDQGSGLPGRKSKSKRAVY